MKPVESFIKVFLLAMWQTEATDVTHWKGECEGLLASLWGLLEQQTHHKKLVVFLYEWEMSRLVHFWLQAVIFYKKQFEKNQRNFYNGGLAS